MLALSRSGQKVNFTPLAEMLGDNDPEIRANAYLVLGELGNDSAVPLIRESLGRGMRLVNPLRVRLVDLAAAEALVKLGDEAEVEPIRAALFAPPEQGELTIVACDSVRRLRDEVARPMLERIVAARGSAERSPEIRLAACRALNRLGNPGVAFTIATEYAQHPDARIRGQVAVLLGEIGTTQARTVLSGLLKDTDPTVQIAAAGGLEPSERMSAGALKTTAD
jgi:HEAT repeat protein